MYTGTNKTALASQKQIAGAFVRLMRKQPYTSITISAICREAGISRQTFYTIFESKDNIVLYILKKKHGFRPGESCTKEEMPLRLLCREYSSYILEKQEILSLLVKNDLIYMMHDSLYHSFMDCPCFCSTRTPRTRAFAAEFVAGGLSGFAKNYIQDDCSLTQSELEKMLYTLFSGDFFSA